MNIAAKKREHSYHGTIPSEMDFTEQFWKFTVKKHNWSSSHLELLNETKIMQNVCQAWFHLVKWFFRKRLTCEKLEDTDNENKVGQKVVTIHHMDILASELIKQVHQYLLSWNQETFIITFTNNICLTSVLQTIYFLVHRNIKFF